MNTQHGLTLIEMLVTLLLGSFVAGTATTLYLSAARSHAIETSALEPVDNATLALTLINQDLRQAGRPPAIESPPLDTALAPIRCEPGNNWVMRNDMGVFAVNDPGNGMHALNRCITLDGTVLSDVLTIWTTALTRESSEPITVSYFLAPAPSLPRNSPCVAAPGLYRMVQQPNKRPYREEIVPGIEALQFTFGLDSDNDGAVDGYYPANRVARWTQVVSVRVEVLARATCALSNYRDTVEYRIGEHTLRPDDPFRRVALAAVTALRRTSAFPTEESHALLPNTAP